MLRTELVRAGQLRVIGVTGQREGTVEIAPALSEIWGKSPLWVHVAASWCLPCLWELKPFFQAAAQLQGRQIEVVLAITDSDGDAEVGLKRLLRKYAEVMLTEAPAVPSNLRVVSDEDFSLSKITEALQGADASGLRQQGIPLSLVFDRCGGLRMWVQNRHDSKSLGEISELLGALKTRAQPCP